MVNRSSSPKIGWWINIIYCNDKTRLITRPSTPRFLVNKVFGRAGVWLTAGGLLILTDPNFTLSRSTHCALVSLHSRPSWAVQIWGNAVHREKIPRSSPGLKLSCPMFWKDKYVLKHIEIRPEFCLQIGEYRLKRLHFWLKWKAGWWFHCSDDFPCIFILGNLSNKTAIQSSNLGLNMAQKMPRARFASFLKLPTSARKVCTKFIDSEWPIDAGKFKKWLCAILDTCDAYGPWGPRLLVVLLKHWNSLDTPHKSTLHVFTYGEKHYPWNDCDDCSKMKATWGSVTDTHGQLTIAWASAEWLAVPAGNAGEP